MSLLGHAAAHTDGQPRILLLEFLQRTDVAEDPLLRVFPYGAGIEEDQIGIFQRIADAEPHILQYTADLFTVVDILLAAIAAHIGQRRCFVISRQHLGGFVVVSISQFFQKNSP